MAQMFVKFWGTRGSLPTPGSKTRRFGGNTACVELRVDDTLLICDAGTGIRELGLEVMRRNKGSITGHLFFSHAHWDHIQGFPFFTPLYPAGNTFYVYGRHAGDDRFFRLLSGQMDSADYFPVSFSELGAQILPKYLADQDGEVDGVKVRWIEQPHPSLAYSFEKGGAKVVFATDSEIDRLLPNRDEVQNDLEAPRQIPSDLVEFARGADLLITDGQYTEAEYPARVGWGHARVTTATDFAIQAGVKQMALFHHDPMHSDADVDRMVATCRARAQRFGSDVFIFGAREGVELGIG
jgi:phosphoribosyl 1,2-cyclic phosphodiesterase